MIFCISSIISNNTLFNEPVPALIEIGDDELKGVRQWEYEDEIASDVERELEKELGKRGLGNFGGLSMIEILLCEI